DPRRQRGRTHEERGGAHGREDTTRGREGQPLARGPLVAPEQRHQEGKLRIEARLSRAAELDPDGATDERWQRSRRDPRTLAREPAQVERFQADDDGGEGPYAYQRDEAHPTRAAHHTSM